MNRVKDEEFHDNESSEDIFDLFNATNGILRQDGLLDVSQLDDYTDEEVEELNVPRLREIWEHTAAGCPQCARIVRMLGEIRGALSEDDERIEAAARSNRGENFFAGRDGKLSTPRVIQADGQTSTEERTKNND